jgi:hypothetical protein
MPGRFGIAGRRLLGQGGLAGSTGLGEVVDYGIDPHRGQPAAEVARVAGLSAPPAPGAGLDDGLGGAWGIGRGKDRGIGSILIELEAELLDEGLQLGGPLQRGVELATQSLALGASGRRGDLLIAHKTER